MRDQSTSGGANSTPRASWLEFRGGKGRAKGNGEEIGRERGRKREEGEGERRERDEGR